jgi:hypothetical protein
VLVGNCLPADDHTWALSCTAVCRCFSASLQCFNAAVLQCLCVAWFMPASMALYRLPGVGTQMQLPLCTWSGVVSFSSVRLCCAVFDLQDDDLLEARQQLIDSYRAARPAPQGALSPPPPPPGGLSPGGLIA